MSSADLTDAYLESVKTPHNFIKIKKIIHKKTTSSKNSSENMDIPEKVMKQQLKTDIFYQLIESAENKQINIQLLKNQLFY